ncbi:MAG: hypothetical protein KDI71_12000 [Xanthomonadales bacterium]|nr:hypothetical protein [Xanthomonadales bacterium]
MARSGLWIALALSLPANAQLVTYQGIAYDPDEGDVLYRESHYLLLDPDGQPAERVVLYRCPKGEPFARKVMQMGADQLRPSFEMTDARLNYVEGLDRRESNALVYVQRDGERDSELLELGQQAVADAGFDAFVRQNWQQLQAGERVRFDFLVPSRLSVMSFKVYKLREDLIDGAPASTFSLNLSGILGWFVSGLEVSYRDQDQALLRFEGLSNVRDPEGDNYVARIEFKDQDRQEDADPALLSAAREEPLVSQCAP